jgi:hypothetical protein
LESTLLAYNYISMQIKAHCTTLHCVVLANCHHWFSIYFENARHKLIRKYLKRIILFSALFEAFKMVIEHQKRWVTETLGSRYRAVPAIGPCSDHLLGEKRSDKRDPREILKFVDFWTSLKSSSLPGDDELLTETVVISPTRLTEVVTWTKKNII